MVDRNPSPPPEIQQACEELRGGQIGDTLFSQTWLFQTLLDVIKYTEEKVAPAQNELSDEDMVSMDELRKEIEDSMCTLWDMSADKDVAHFLVEFKAREIFLGIIEKTRSPRLLEIVSGILGNMAFYEDICDHFTESNDFVNAVLQLLGTTDTPTLIQVIRLIHVSTAHSKAGAVWINMLKNESSSSSHLLHILENSLNVELLKSTLKYLYYLLDEPFQVFSLWSAECLVNALSVSATHFESINDCESLLEYWHLLHLLSRAEGYVATLASQEEVISRHLRFYVSQFMENEDPIPATLHVTGLAAAFSTFNSFASVENADITSLSLLRDGCIMQYIKDLHGSLQRKLELHPESESGPSNWRLLVDVLTETITLSEQLTTASGTHSAEEPISINALHTGKESDAKQNCNL